MLRGDCFFVEKLLHCPRMTAANVSPTTPQPKQNILRRLYAWTLHWSETRYAVPALCLISFVESSFFLIPPDVLLIAMCFATPKKWWKLALYCTLASVAGGVFGWFIGHAFWDVTQGFFFKVPGFTRERFDLVQTLFKENAFLAIFGAAFTPIPYKIFTLASGVFNVDLGTLVSASLFGRGGRFFLVAGLIRLFGPTIRPFLEKHFELTACGLFLLGILGFVALRFLH